MGNPQGDGTTCHPVDSPAAIAADTVVAVKSVNTDGAGAAGSPLPGAKTATGESVRFTGNAGRPLSRGRVEPKVARFWCRPGNPCDSHARARDARRCGAALALERGEPSLPCPANRLLGEARHFVELPLGVLWDEVLEVLVASVEGRFRRIGDRIEISGLEGELRDPSFDRPNAAQTRRA